MDGDKVLEALMAGLRLALAEPGEQRLFRSGKLAGLFPTRAGASGEAAERAVRERLVEIVRSEPKGKLTTDWVRITPAGVNVLHAHESPRAVLEELKSALATTRSGVPVWLETMQGEVQQLSQRLSGEMQTLLHKLDALERRVAEALKRTDTAIPALANGIAESVPWAADVLTYLDRRDKSGATTGCPLPELFAALRERRPGLQLGEFHHGLRRLGDYHAVALAPFSGPAYAMPEPEYALLDGATMLYYVSRA